MEVYFNYDRCEGRGKPGKECKINQEFVWGGRKGILLSLYICREGMVMDLGFSASTEEMEEYLSKWTVKRRRSGLSQEEYDEMDRDKPFPKYYKAEISVNDQSIQRESMYSVIWHPFGPQKRISGY